MPAKSKAQQRLMQAAEHGANFPMAQKVRASMTKGQMHDFAVGSEQGKPQHVRKPGTPHPGGYGARMAHAGTHPGRNLKGFLHPRRTT